VLRFVNKSDAPVGLLWAVHDRARRYAPDSRVDDPTVVGRGVDKPRNLGKSVTVE